MELVYKPKGVLGTEIAYNYKIKNNKKKVCICGKLDPMAQGQLLLLYDDNCKNMNNHLIHDKTYRFQVLWGIKTDSDDVLGLITHTNIEQKYNKNYIDSKLNYFIGKSVQSFHNFSAIHVSNKNGEKYPLWEWSNLNRLNEIEVPQKNVNVRYIKQLYTYKKNFKIIKKEILENIKNIKGNFRQDIIKEQWNNINYETDFYITEFEAYVSTGYYIRQFINDFVKKTNLYGLAYDINRIKIHN